nr:nuclear transport factor 2 family protein [uncultured Niameybacter sp.]
MQHLQNIVQEFFKDVIKQDAYRLKSYFTIDARINWHNTNESFNVDEYIIANCEYPGEWCGEIERIEQIETLVISVARVWLQDMSASFHVTSFFEFKDDKIQQLNEYWGDDGLAPKWRQDKQIGSPIK